MKKFSFKKLLFKGMVLIGFALILLIGFILNPSLSYAHHTQLEGIHVYHQDPLSPELEHIIQESNRILEQAKLPLPKETKLCLKEGFYPKLIEAILGADVIRAFRFTNVVLADLDKSEVFFHWRGHKLKYSQFLAHARVHNMQYLHHGFWDANPMGAHPEWKWEGYADYVVLAPNYSLSELWESYQENKGDPHSFLDLGQGTGSLKLHIRYLMMVKYCLDTKAMSYQSLMNQDLEEAEIWKELQAYMRTDKTR